MIPGTIVKRMRRRAISRQSHISRAALLILHLTSSIAAAALLNFAAFFNLIAYIVEGQWWTVAIACFLAIVILTRFPTKIQLEEWTERQLELVERDRGD